MYRLITQIENKYIRGPCGPPYKHYLEFEKPDPPQQLSPKKNFLIQNFGESHLYRNTKMENISLESQHYLPAIRSNIVLVMGLSQQSLDEIVTIFLKQKDKIIQMEIIKNRNKRILLVVVFLLNQAAQEFYLKYNFSMMPDESHLLTVFLEDIIYIKASSQKNPQQLHLLLVGTPQYNITQDWIQLPLCLTCLQKLQSRLSGILYLEYGQDIETRKPNLNCSLCVENMSSTKCSSCGETKQIWGCLICGSLGCGRYKEGHAQIHCAENNHIFAMEMGTNRIWSYEQDTFVHRILAGESNVVNFPQNNFGQNQGQSTDGINWDYVNQISEQLEKQRNFYQTRLSQQQSKFKLQKQSLQSELFHLKQAFGVRSKQANFVKNKREKHEKKKKDLKNRIDEQKQMNKLIEYSIRASSEATQESDVMRRKKQQLSELQSRLSQLLSQLDYS